MKPCEIHQKIIVALCLLLVAMLCLFAAGAEKTGEEEMGVIINKINFPDPYFLSYVKGFDTDNDKTLSEAELAVVDQINVAFFSLQTLKGIEYFTALKSLDCANNNLVVLDISRNTALKTLDCSNNELKALDVSRNTALKTLDCSYNELKALDVSRNTDLDIFYCANNMLTALDVSKSSILRDLDCSKNKLEILDVSGSAFLKGLVCSENKLAALDISKNTDLKLLECYDNQLRMLDVSQNTDLESLECYNNQLGMLDVSKNTALVKLDCHDNMMTSLDLGQNTALTELICSNNQITALDTENSSALIQLKCDKNQLKSLDISKLERVKELDCSYNQLTILDVSYCSSIVQLIDNYEREMSKDTQKWESYGWYDDYLFLKADKSVEIVGGDQTGLPIDEQTFPDEVFRDYVEYFDINKNGLLTEREIEAVETIDIEYDAIESLQGIENFTSLESLDCGYNELTSLDVSKNTALKTLLCTGNHLITLDISHNSSLVHLDCSENPISELDIQNNTHLEKLHCTSTMLTKLDINKCPRLVDLVKNIEPTETETTLCWEEYDSDVYRELYVDRSLELSNESITTDNIRGYVTRCYEIILGRKPDEDGMHTWFNELNSGRKAAAEIIDRFVNSPEYMGKKYSYSDSVDILYRAMLGRDADPAGKANWVSKLESGQPFAAVINGFCVSKEFNQICASYGIRPGSVTIPGEAATPEEKIKAFVRRCYQIILNREPDEGGMNTWFDELKANRKAASEIIDRFVNSSEFQEKNLNNSDAVEILYKAMLGRGSDPAGKANWVRKLENGQPFAVVINGFCVSKEFTGICASYGIKAGNVNVQLSGIADEEALSMLALNAKAPITRRSETKPNRVEIINPSDTIDMNIGTAVQAVYINEEKAKEFIGRCYRVILGREASEAEVENWIGQMVNGTKTPDQIARGFLFSNEFKAKNTANEELVKILYRVYMNRDADPEGLKSWTEKLDNGTSLKDLLDAFSKTNEFKKVVSEMSK